RRWLALGISLAVAQSLSLLPVPLLVGRAIDEVSNGGSTKKLFTLTVLMVVLTAANAVLMVLSQLVVFRATKAATEKLRLELVDKIYRLGLPQVREIDDAVLHDRLVSETGKVDTMASVASTILLPGCILVVGIGAVLIAQSWELGLVIVSLGPLMAVLTRFTRSSMGASMSQAHGTYERFSADTLTMLKVQELTRSVDAAHVERARLADRIAALRNASGARLVRTTAYTASQIVLVALGSAVVLLVGGHEVIEGTMTPGDLVSFYAGVALIRNPLSSLTSSYPALVEGRQSLGRVVELLDRPGEDRYTGTRHVVPESSLQLNGVGFAYGAHQVLTDVDLAITRGTVTALLGPNGAGKSTVVSLLLGFTHPSSGVVTADGISYEELHLGTLRRNIGYVGQHPQFLPSSLRDNLCYGMSAVSDSDIAEALERARATAVVDALPNGLDTIVGDDGYRLSGGQRQRLALARALLGRPTFLILDEPGNHLDQAAVDELVESLRNLPGRPGLLIVSHRPELVAHVDHVVTLGVETVETVEPIETDDPPTLPSIPPVTRVDAGGR
ncbi:MAG: ABC transporter ATP-binding protein, partial [Acidimicrobiia bacterium]